MHAQDRRGGLSWAVIALVCLTAALSMGASNCGGGSAGSTTSGRSCRDTYVGSDVPHGSAGYRRASGHVERCTCNDGEWQACRIGDPLTDTPDAGPRSYPADAGAPDAGPPPLPPATLSFATPSDGDRVPSPVTFRLRTSGLATLELSSDGFSMGPRLTASSTTTTTYPFTRGGRRRITARGYDASGSLVATDEITIEVALPAPERCFPVTVPYQGPGYCQSYGAVGCGRGHVHAGVDLVPPIDMQDEATSFPILAHLAGEVVQAGGGGYGIVRIRHDDGTYSRYLHNSRVVVEMGQRVEACDVVAYMGTAGTSVPHLHFEMQTTSGGATDAMPYILGSDRRSPRSDIEVRSHPEHGAPRSIGGGL